MASPGHSWIEVDRGTAILNTRTPGSPGSPHPAGRQERRAKMERGRALRATAGSRGTAETELEALLRRVAVEKRIDEKKKRRICFNNSVIHLRLFSEDNL